MNTMVKRLILKDWYLQRWLVGGYFAAGILSLVILGLGSQASFYAGTVLLITVLVAMSAQVVMATVVKERSELTLPFIMTMPVSTRQYATAKILANVLIVFLPWAALALGTIGEFAASPKAQGLIPFAVITLTELLVSYSLMLAVAIITESEGWTIGMIVAGNLFLQGFLYVVSHIPSIGGNMGGGHAVWSQPAILILLGELAAIPLILGLTYYVQSKKTDFL
jgi:ABC-2 type transport system permease protein